MSQINNYSAKINDYLVQSWKNINENYFQLSFKQYVIMLGIAISGLAVFINTYNAASGINSQMQNCSQPIQSKLTAQYVVVLIVSILAIAIGAFLAWYIRKKSSSKNLLAIGLATAGVFGLIYAICVRFQSASNGYKLGISWITFLAFIILGIFSVTHSHNDE